MVVPLAPPSWYNVGALLPGSFHVTLQLVLQVGGERWFPDRVTHERVIHTSDEHRETRRSKFKILTVIKSVSYDAEVKPPSTFGIKSRTHQAEGTFINVSAETVRFRISHTPREGCRNS